jgi:hypothetical protein
LVTDGFGLTGGELGAGGSMLATCGGSAGAGALALVVGEACAVLVEDADVAGASFSGPTSASCLHAPSAAEPAMPAASDAARTTAARERRTNTGSSGTTSITRRADPQNGQAGSPCRT